MYKSNMTGDYIDKIVVRKQKKSYVYSNSEVRVISAVNVFISWLLTQPIHHQLSYWYIALL